MRAKVSQPVAHQLCIHVACRCVSRRLLSFTWELGSIDLTQTRGGGLDLELEGGRLRERPAMSTISQSIAARRLVKGGLCFCNCSKCTSGIVRRFSVGEKRRKPCPFKRQDKNLLKIQCVGELQADQCHGPQGLRQDCSANFDCGYIYIFRGRPPTSIRTGRCCYIHCTAAAEIVCPLTVLHMLSMCLCTVCVGCAEFVAVSQHVGVSTTQYCLHCMHCRLA